MTASLRFEKYGFTYSSAAAPAIDDISIDIRGGKVVSVIAAQGRGKTTFLRAAAGLLGEIYNGTTTGAVTSSSAQRAGAFFDGYVQVTLAVETVREEIALPLYATVSSRSVRHARVAAVARELRIEHLLDRDVTSLSGGEEKLVGIAAALVPETHTYVLDEPFEQLDVGHLSRVMQAAKRRARQGSVVLVATGSVDIALNIAEAAIVFDGQAWSLAEPAEYGDVARIEGLRASSVSEYLRARGSDGTGVRRFRDAVRRVS
jgi:energy-coupling factor transporter ATP-binding protein EcfA2